MKQCSESYQMGELVGELIERKYLLTLSTDMIRGYNTVEVTDKNDLDTFHQLEKELNKTYTWNGGDGNSTEKHRVWLDHVYKLADKYLPKKLKCSITKIEPHGMEDFKKGLEGYLWNTDLSWYIPKDDFFKPNHEYSIRTVIILTRTDRDE